MEKYKAGVDVNDIKKVAAIHDISGLGRCSLSVILPVMSAMGLQVCPVTTSVLSAHTGFGEFVMRDLTDFMMPALEHYKKLGTEFDCIYSGFLGSEDQIDHCLEYFRTLTLLWAITVRHMLHIQALFADVWVSLWLWLI